MYQLLKKSALVCLGVSFLLLNTLEAIECAAAQQECGNGLTVQAEWLYWKPIEDVQLGNDSTTDKRTTRIYKQNYYDLDFDSGFRLGINYHNYECCNWDLNLSWTNYSTTQTDKVIVQELEQKSKVNGRLSIDLDYVDLEFGYPMCCNECFVLRPHVGIRYLSDHISNKWVSTELETDEVTSIEQVDKFKGTGLRFGFDAEWSLACGLGIYGNFSQGLTYDSSSSYKNKSTFVAESESNIDQELAVRNAAYLNWDYNLGAGVYYNTCCYGTEVTARLGWEHNVLCYTNVRGLRAGLGVAF